MSSSWNRLSISARHKPQVQDLISCADFEIGGFRLVGTHRAFNPFKAKRILNEERETQRLRARPGFAQSPRAVPARSSMNGVKRWAGRGVVAQRIRQPRVVSKYHLVPEVS